MVFKNATKKSHDPALAVNEMRDLIDQLIGKAREENVPAYRVAEILETAARTVRIKHAATTPIQ
jgi:hypothetical protein